MFGDVVMEMKPESKEDIDPFEEIIDQLKEEKKVNLDTDLTTDDLKELVKRFKKGIEVNEETMAVDLIDEVGIGGHYIQETHTLDYFRSETWQPQLLDRSVIDEWVEQGSKDLAEQTKSRVKEILAKPAEKKLNDEQARELSDIIKNRGG